MDGGEAGWGALKGLLELGSVEAVGRESRRGQEWLWVRLKGNEVIRRSVDDLMVASALGAEEARDSALRSLRLAVVDRERAREFRDRGKRLQESVKDSPFVAEDEEVNAALDERLAAEERVLSHKMSGVRDAELRGRFTHRPPGSGRWSVAEDVEFYEEFRRRCLELARYVVEHTPASREQSRALTALDDVCFNGNAARARRG